MNKIRPVRVIESSGGIGDYLPVLRARASRLRRALNDAETSTAQFGVAATWAAITFVLATVAARLFG